MRFGLYLPNQADFADVATLAALARDAEDAGWDGIFIWDEIVPVYEYAVGRPKAESELGTDWAAAADGIVALTAIAAATEAIRFGTLVTPVSRLRPEVFAHQTATLDRFSGGRLVVGVGLGNPDTQFRAFGHPTDPRVRASQVDEFLTVLTALWTGRPVDAGGSYFTARGIALRPPPVQQPRIPIWVGADSGRRRPRRRAARWDGFVPASPGWPNEVIPPAEFGRIAEDIGPQRSSDAPFDLVLIGNADATQPTPGALDDYAGVGVTWLLVQALTLDAARARITAGPPRPPSWPARG